jgi:thiol:disulfide interchange protein DsbC
MSIADKRNVTKTEAYKLRRVDLSTIPLTDSVVVGNPKASKKLILFTDPQCPYCEKLHPELDKVVKADPEVVFFIKMMPLASIHPDSPRIAKAVLCEGTTKLLEDSFAGKKIPDPTCQSDAVERTLRLAQDLGIGSTPTLILPDGRIVPGYRPADAILEMLKEKKP